MSLWHWLVVLAVVLLLFGTGKLTRSFGELAQGVRNFRDGLKDDPEPEPPPPAEDVPPEPLKALPPPEGYHASDAAEAPPSAPATDASPNPPAAPESTPDADRSGA